MSSRFLVLRGILWILVIAMVAVTLLLPLSYAYAMGTKNLENFIEGFQKSQEQQQENNVREPTNTL